MSIPLLRITLFQDALPHKCLFGAVMTTWAWVAIHVSLKQYGQFLPEVADEKKSIVIHSNELQEHVFYVHRCIAKLLCKYTCEQCSYMTYTSGTSWKKMVQEQEVPGISLGQVTTMWLLRKNWLFFTKKMQPLSSPHALWPMIPPSSHWRKCFQVIIVTPDTAP